MRLYSQKDVDKKALKGARIAILGYGSQGRAHALNLQGQRLRRGGRRAQGRRQLEEGEEGRPGRRRARRGGRRRRPRRHAGAGHWRRRPSTTTIKGGAEERRHAAVRARLQHPLQADQAAQGPGRGADRPQGPGRPGAPPVPAGPRRAVPDRGRAGRHRQGARARPRLRRTASAARAAGCSRPPSPRRPRPTCSASRRCCAAAPPSWSSRASRRWSRPATSPRSPTTSACTS